MSDETENSGKSDGGGAGRSRDTQLIKPSKQNFFSGLWSSFLAGIVVVAPIGITIALVYWFVTGPMAKLDAFVKQTLPFGDSTIDSIVEFLPGVGVFVAFVAVMVLGALAKNIFGRAFIRVWERLFESVPIVRNVFGFLKNVFQTALQQSERSFKEVALIQYPRPGAWVMAFVIGEAKGEIKVMLDDQGEELTALFVPTVPNPTSGFLLFIPRSDMRVLSMSVEDAAKTVLSLGLVVPEYNSPDDAVKKLEEMAAKAQKEPLRKRLFGSGKS